MKKILFCALIGSALTFGAASCSDSNSASDSDFPKQLVDSLSMTYGAFDGTRLNQFASNIEDMDEFIEGYQLVVGNEFSVSKYNGMAAALEAVQAMYNMKMSTGIDINRDLYLQEFRKYIQSTDLSNEELAGLYQRLEKLGQSVEEILQKREAQAQQQEPAPAPEAVEAQTPVEATENVTVEEEIEIPENINTTDNTDFNYGGAV